MAYPVARAADLSQGPCGVGFGHCAADSRVYHYCAVGLFWGAVLTLLAVALLRVATSMPAMGQATGPRLRLGADSGHLNLRRDSSRGRCASMPARPSALLAVGTVKAAAAAAALRVSGEGGPGSFATRPRSSLDSLIARAGFSHGYSYRRSLDPVPETRPHTSLDSLAERESSLRGSRRTMETLDAVLAAREGTAADGGLNVAGFSPSAPFRARAEWEAPAAAARRSARVRNTLARVSHLFAGSDTTLNCDTDPDSARASFSESFLARHPSGSRPSSSPRASGVGSHRSNFVADFILTFGRFRPHLELGASLDGSRSSESSESSRPCVEARAKLSMESEQNGAWLRFEPGRGNF